MSVKCISWAFDHAGTIKDPVAHNILLSLADFANEHHQCWPSHATIAARVYVSVPTIKRKLNLLHEKGLIDWGNQVRDDGGMGSNVYDLLIDTPPDQNDLPPTPDDPPPRSDDDLPPSSPDDLPPRSEGDLQTVIDPPVDPKEEEKPASAEPSDFGENFTEQLNGEQPTPRKPKPGLLASQCKKGGSTYCNCKDCKTSVKRIILNHDNRWKQRGYFDCPSSRTLIKHWSEWETDHAVDDILGEIDAAISQKKYKPGAEKPLSTVIEAAILRLDFAANGAVV